MRNIVTDYVRVLPDSHDNYHAAHTGFLCSLCAKEWRELWTAVIDPGRRLISRVPGCYRRFVGGAGYFLIENGTMGRP